jgi:hypothetical protein
LKFIYLRHHRWFWLALIMRHGVAVDGFVDFKQGVSLDVVDIPHAQSLPLLEIMGSEAQRYLIRPIRERFRLSLTELDALASAIGAATFILDAEFDHGFARRLLPLEGVGVG